MPNWCEVFENTMEWYGPHHPPQSAHVPWWSPPLKNFQKMKSGEVLRPFLKKSLTQVKKRQNHSQLFVTESIANRRLSSPPALEKDVFYFNHMAQAYTKQHHKNHRKNRQSYDDCWDQDQAGSGSSSTGSLQKLNISGLNPSSSDLRVNTVISGHQVCTLM